MSQTQKRGKLNLRILIAILIIGNFSVAQSQSLAKINCLVPYEITFSKNLKTEEYNRVVEYEHHDEHTFWYKLSFEESINFSYQISSLDNQNNFDVYFYQYDGTNFCRSFIQENLELISFEKNLEYKVSKGSSYFLGLFPLSEGGCGHQISFTLGKNELILKAKNLHVRCDEDDVVINPENSEDLNKIQIIGEVVDKETGNKLNARITLIDPFTGHQQQLFSSDVDGFRANLLEDGDYKVKIQAFGYKDEMTAISVYDGEFYKFSLNSSDQKKYILNNVYFYPNTYALKDESKEELESIYSYLFNHPGVQFEIIGHTNGNKDVRASRMVREKGEEWNFNGSAQELSLRRATRIKEYMMKKGVDEILIKVSGKGGSEMIVQNPTNMMEAMKNIRVEIKIADHN